MSTTIPVETGWLDELATRYGAPVIPAPIRNGRTLSRTWSWRRRLVVHLVTFDATDRLAQTYTISVRNGRREVDVRDEGVPTLAGIRRALVEAGLLGCEICGGFLEVPGGRDTDMEAWRRCRCAPVTARPPVGWAQVTA